MSYRNHLAKSLNIHTVFVVIPIIVTIAAYCYLWINRKKHVAKTRQEKNNSIACTLPVMTVVFICTWYPFIFLVSILDYVCSLHPDKCRPLTNRSGISFASYFTKLLQYSNSSVSPFIYALRMHSFRDKALEIFCCSKIGKLHFTS